QLVPASPDAVSPTSLATKMRLPAESIWMSLIARPSNGVGNRDHVPAFSTQTPSCAPTSNPDFEIAIAFAPGEPRSNHVAQPSVLASTAFSPRQYSVPVSGSTSSASLSPPVYTGARPQSPEATFALETITWVLPPSAYRVPSGARARPRMFPPGSSGIGENRPKSPAASKSIRPHAARHATASASRMAQDTT